MASINYYLKLYCHYLKLSFSKIKVYKLDFLVGSFVFIGCQFFSLLSIFFIFNQVTTFENWNIYMILFLQNFVLLVLNISDFISDNLWTFSGTMVVRGTYDEHMLKPYHPLFSILISDIHIDSIGSILISLIFICIAIIYGNLKISLILFLISVMSSVIIIISIKIVLAALAFKLKKCRALLFLCFQFFDACRYPITIYPLAIRIFLSIILPFALASYYPTVFMFKNNFISLIGILLLSFIILFVAIKIWDRLSKYYDSTGN